MNLSALFLLGFRSGRSGDPRWNGIVSVHSFSYKASVRRLDTIARRGLAENVSTPFVEQGGDVGCDVSVFTVLYYASHLSAEDLNELWRSAILISTYGEVHTMGQGLYSRTYVLLVY